jgi:malonyl-CoA O-methyltransferase
MSTERPPTIDALAAARWQQRVVESSAWLHEEVARRMQERLDIIRLQPKAWAHWEPLHGGLGAQASMTRRYPNATSFMAFSITKQAQFASKNIATPWWRPAYWAGPKTLIQVPPDGGVQMLWANMLLHHATDPLALMARWHRALAVDGFLMFSCLGPDTLRELRALYAEAGWGWPSHEFTDMHDWGDMLVAAGFAEPVMDMERITLTFESPVRLLAELRSLGRNLHRARFGALRGRAWQGELHRRLAARLANPKEGGRLSLTFEVIYGHALKPVRRLNVRAETTLSLDDMRQALARGKLP